jgi:hypothetical protein
MSVSQPLFTNLYSLYMLIYIYSPKHMYIYIYITWKFTPYELIYVIYTKKYFTLEYRYLEKSD